MSDFYSELGAAVRGRLAGANTLARVNDALRDTFEAFILEPPPHPLGDGICITPILHFDRFQQLGGDWDKLRDWIKAIGDIGSSATADDERITPPLRKLHAPSAELANAQEPWHSDNRVVDRLEDAKTWSSFADVT
jgi:hypothetical protein